MPQRKAWENEYKDSKLVTLSDKPQKDFLNFLKFLKKERKLIVTDLNVLDLGCGVGKNSIYLAKLDNTVVGLDISPTAITESIKRAEGLVGTNFKVWNIGSSYPYDDGSFDLVLDVISSNSLNKSEREIYLKEVARVLKPGGNFFVRALKLEADKNAKYLLKTNPGPDKNTYTLKDLNLTEKVFTRDEITETYSKYFKILKIDSKSSYTKYKNQSYKRHYYTVYMTTK